MQSEMLGGLGLARARRLAGCPERDEYPPQRARRPSIDNLVAQLTRLPGIGSRTAQRLAFHLLQVSKQEATRARRGDPRGEGARPFLPRVRQPDRGGDCAICRDARRDHSVICVVEQPVDLVSLERTAEFRGLYHVLGGSLSPLDGVEPEHLRIDELFDRVSRNGVTEVVLATNPNMTGEATAAYLADRLRGRVRVTRLASGLPVGGDLEYADEVTLGRAFVGRREMSVMRRCLLLAVVMALVAAPRLRGRRAGDCARRSGRRRCTSVRRCPCSGSTRSVRRR